MTKPIVIFTSPNCKYCKMTKDFFQTKEIPYLEIDITKDLKSQQEMIEKSGQMGVPVIEIDHKIIIGFDQAAIEKELS